MISSDKERETEQTFVVFAADPLPLGIAADAVLSIASPPAHQQTSAKDSVERLLILRSADGIGLPAVPVHGALRMVTLRSAQLSGLPALCRGPESIAVAVAIEDDRVLFLIVDPIAFSNAQMAHPSSPPARESL